MPQTPGEFKLTLRAAEQPGELVTTNNEMSTFVTVLAGGINVLYLEGALRVDQVYLRRSLDASPDIKVDFVRLDPRDPKTRPADLAERFQPGKYDVYVLGDGDSLLKDKIHSLVFQGRKQIVLNMAGVSFVDSTGLGILVASYVTIKNGGGQIKLVSLTKRLQDLLAIAKLVTVFDSYDSEDDAIRSFPAAATA